MDSDGFFGADPVEFAGNGRYLLDIDGNGQKSYTRATTIAKTLEATFHLNQWQQKNAVRGVAMRPDLTARAVVTPVENKAAWKEILGQAEIVAAGGAKANLGSAFHELHDNVARMSDDEYAAVPADIRDLYEKYRAELARLGIVELVSETTVCAEQIGTAGKADGFVRMPDGSVRVLDRKSGRVTEYPHAPAVQLAVYANASRILMPSEGGPKWMAMAEVFPEMDLTTGMIVDVKYATESTPSSVHVYEIDLTAGWFGALLACKVRRWRNRKDLLTPYQPEQMPVTKIAQHIPVSPELAKDVGAPFDAPLPKTVAPSETTGTHPAWSSAQQSVIQVNPDGTAAAPVDPTAGVKAVIAAAASPAVVAQMGEQLQKVAGYTYEQIQNGEHLNAAEKASQMAAAALQAAADRQEAVTAEAAQAPSSAQDFAGDKDVLLKQFKDKASLQAAARRLDASMNVSRTRANLANDMINHAEWAARRGEFVAAAEAAPAWKPAPQQVAAAVEAQASAAQQYPNAGLPDTTSTAAMPPAQNNPFASAPVAPVDPPNAPKSPEDLALERIAGAVNQAGIAQIWEDCQKNGIPWSPRMQQAAQTRMSSFTN